MWNCKGKGHESLGDKEVSKVTGLKCVREKGGALGSE